MVLTEFSIGSLLMTCVLPPREIRASFFTLISLLCALAAALALVLSKAFLQAGWADVRLLGESVRPLAVGQVRSASSVALRSGGLST